VTFLGIDLGTSALKSVLVDDAQALLAEATVPLASSHPRPGWSEQHPGDWWSAFLAAIAKLRAARPDAFAAIRAIGLSGQMHGAVLTDERDDAIRPAILWNDSRAARECQALLQAVPDLPTIAGIIPMPGFTAPKLLWLREHEGENFARISKVLSPKDYLRLKLTGDVTTDVSDAAGTLWLDQGVRDWSTAILAASGLALDAMPRLVEGSAPAGNVRPALLAEWGIAHEVLVAGGAADAAASAIGIGAVEEGDAFVSLGTSAQFFVTDARYRPQPGTLLHAFAHALPDRWYRMAAMLNGATCLQWVAGILGASDLAALLARTEADYCGPSRALFLPYLSGERTPHNDADARGVLTGLDHDANAADLVQAVLEGVVFSLVEARDLMERAGVTLPKVAAVGGGAKSRFWMQLLAHALGIPVVRYAGSETGPAVGAARLAIMALTSARPRDICARPPILDVLEPDPALHAAYAERFQAYRSLYPGLKPVVSRMRGVAPRRGAD
jgi:xylulokinase